MIAKQRCQARTLSTTWILFALAIVLSWPQVTFAAEKQSSVSSGAFQILDQPPSQLSIAHDPIVLSNNRVLFLSDNNYLVTYDASTNKWTTERISGIAKPSAIAKLGDNQLLLIGGLSANGVSYQENVILDLTTRQTKPAAKLPGTIAGFVNMDAETLPNGNILLIGYYNIHGINENFVYLYDPAKDEWTKSADLTYVASTLTANPNGDVLNTGGKAGEYFSHGQLYRAKNNQFYTTSMIPTPISYPSVTAMSNGDFLHAGGSDGGGAVFRPTNKALIFQVDQNYWQTISPMKVARSGAAAASLPDGKVIIAGGTGTGSKPLNTTEVYDPSTNQWLTGPNLNLAYSHLKAIPLSKGNILFVGGKDDKVQVELLVWGKDQQAETPQTTKPPANSKKLVGKEVGSQILFQSGDWTYKTVYTLESSLNFRFVDNGVSYTRKYIVREKPGSAREIVLDGSFQYLMEKDGFLYYMENSYLKKMQLDGSNFYGEHIRFSDDIYAKLMFSETSSVLAKHAGATVNLGMTGFDGTYVYSWYTIEEVFGNRGYPIRYKYDGSELEMLSNIPGQGRMNRVGPLALVGDYVVYTRVPSGMKYNDAADAKKVTLHAVKKDGSEEKDLAVAASFDVYRGKVYYGDMGQAPVNGKYGYKIYSVNPDGTDRKLLSSEGQSTDLFFNGDKITFQTNKGDKIIQMNLDGSKQRIIRKNTAKTSYMLQKVVGNYIVYHKRVNDDWVGNYQLNLSTMKETLVQAPPKK